MQQAKLPAGLAQKSNAIPENNALYAIPASRNNTPRNLTARSRARPAARSHPLEVRRPTSHLASQRMVKDDRLQQGVLT